MTHDSTPSQKAAITSEDPTILCLAGPGSGKTTVLVHRIHRLIAAGANPRAMIAITFTNAAARELDERLGKFIAKRDVDADELVTDKDVHFPARLGYVGTLHGFALKMLKEHGAGIGYGERMAIISPESAADLLASKAQQVGCKTKLADLMKWKMKGIPATFISDGIHPPQRLRLCKEDLTVLSYYDELREAGIVDFDVLLEEFARMVKTPMAWPAYTHLFVDEVQDSGRLDWQIYKGLPMANKFLVGDPDQAIYSFRGGEVDQMLKFAKEPGVTLIPLEENFRSHPEICQAAQRLIEHNRDRFPKATISAKGPGGSIVSFPEHYNEGEEIARVVRTLQDEKAGGFEFGEVAILARNNHLAHEFTKALMQAGVPVILTSKADLPKDWAFARAFVEFMVDPENDTLAFFLLIALEKLNGENGEGSTIAAHTARREAAKDGISLNRRRFKMSSNLPAADAPRELQKWSGTRESAMLIAEKLKELPSGASMLELSLHLSRVRDQEKEVADAGVTVSTIHGAKGREWDVVFIVGLEDETIPGTRKNTNVEEERRLAYVAVTRARKAVFLSWAAARLATWGKLLDHTPSRFIKELLG